MDPRFNQQPNQPYQPTPMPGQSPVPGQSPMPAGQSYVGQPYTQPAQPQPVQQPMPQPAQQPYTQPVYQQPQYQAPVQPAPQPYIQPIQSTQPIPQNPQTDYSEQGMGIENAYEGMGTQPNPYLTDNIVPSMNDTEPITERDPLPEPDPIAEALKAPIQAAAPVPGSIGSNTSVKKSKKSKDAAQQVVVAPAKKRNPVLIALIIISILAIIGLAVVLLLQLYPDLFNFGSSSQQQQKPSQPSVSVTESLSCERTLKSSELLNYSNAISGIETFTIDYADKEISKVISGFELKYENTSNANIGSDKLRSDYVNSFKRLDYTTDPFKSNYSIADNVLTVLHEATGSEINETNMELFNLTIAKDGTINTPIDTVKSTYTKLNFTCKNE